MLPETAAILKAARIPPDVHIDNPDLLATAILNDGEVCDIALQLAIDAYKLDAISHVESFVRLHKRVGVPQPAPALVKPVVGWAIEQGIQSGTWYVVARCDGETIRISQPHPNLEWHGAKIPQAILDQYKRATEQVYISANTAIDEGYRDRYKVVGQ